MAILKFKMEALSYEILIAIIQICCMGIISLLKNMMTLCPPTGNEKLVWLMHYRGYDSSVTYVTQYGGGSRPYAAGEVRRRTTAIGIVSSIFNGSVIGRECNVPSILP